MCILDERERDGVKIHLIDLCKSQGKQATDESFAPS